ncbi:hypothetical protein COW64_21620 [bacterium (Candidatus Blackallbacteria) CG18_big_fil_WC_8_21_14_2_50_49_26]|nr:MAG: hypothetical protein COW64_21620 [bacterium (Candidatus Blackallbacteria) CG18_big_fil_WC_8_21_14_2_50_49_26]
MPKKSIIIFCILFAAQIFRSSPVFSNEIEDHNLVTEIGRMVSQHNIFLIKEYHSTTESTTSIFGEKIQLKSLIVKQPSKNNINSGLRIEYFSKQTINPEIIAYIDFNELEDLVSIIKRMKDLPFEVELSVPYIEYEYITLDGLTFGFYSSSKTDYKWYLKIKNKKTFFSKNELESLIKNIESAYFYLLYKKNKNYQ